MCRIRYFTVSYLINFLYFLKKTQQSVLIRSLSVESDRNQTETSLSKNGSRLPSAGLGLIPARLDRAPQTVLSMLIPSPSLSSPSLQDLFHCAYGVSLCSGEDGYFQPSSTSPTGREKKASSFCPPPSPMKESCSLAGRG